MNCYHGIPLSEPGTPISFEEDPLLAPGVGGYVIQETDGSLYIPEIHAIKEGSGDVGRFLDSLPPGLWKVPSVVSGRLMGMLLRRGFKGTKEDSIYGSVPVMVKEVKS